MLSVAAAALVPMLLGAGAAANRIEGEVLLSRGGVLIVRSGGVTGAVAVEPSTSLRGTANVEDLEPGDRVVVRWSRSEGAIRIAEVVEAEPPVVPVRPTLEMRAAEAVQRLFLPPGKRADLRVVDVRPRKTFEEGHLPGALSAPLERFASEARKLVPDLATPLLLYGEGARDPSALVALRQALAAGYSDVRVLAGGYRAWWNGEHPAEIEAVGLLRLLQGRERLLVLDVRARALSAGGSIPGAVSMELGALDTAALAGESWVPPAVIVGADAADPSAHAFADRLRNWRDQGMHAAEGPPLLLAGGIAAWVGAGGRLAAPRTTLPLFVDPAAGEIPRDEFLALWRARGGERTLLLDVRPTSGEGFARRLPLERFAAEAGSLPRDREIVVFCAVGKRSRVAYEALKASGFRARYLRGMPPTQ